MKGIFLKLNFILVLYLLYSCNDKTETSYPIDTESKPLGGVILDTVYISVEELEVQPLGGKGLYKGLLFTGYVTRFHGNKQLAEKTFYLDGRKEGVAKYWFEDGTVKKTKQFVNNKLNGKTIVYFRNGQLASVKNYLNNRQDGLQEVWHRNGQIYKRQNYLNGKARGLQQAWLNNGKIFANYESRNGRNFGLNRMDLCFGLNDEKIKE